MTFNNWIETLISEKSIDTEEYFSVEGESGENMMPYSVVIEAIKKAPANEQQQIKNTLVKIDFMNGDIRHFFRHLAQAIAI